MCFLTPKNPKISSDAKAADEVPKRKKLKLSTHKVLPLLIYFNISLVIATYCGFEEVLLQKSCFKITVTMQAGI